VTSRYRVFEPKPGLSDWYWAYTHEPDVWHGPHDTAADACADARIADEDSGLSSADTEDEILRWLAVVASIVVAGVALVFLIRWLRMAAML
jgi:hypothetical protein